MEKLKYGQKRLRAGTTERGHIDSGKDDFQKDLSIGSVSENIFLFSESIMQ